MKRLNLRKWHKRSLLGYAIILLLFFMGPGCKESEKISPVAEKVKPPVAEKVKKEWVISRLVEGL